MSNRLMLFKKWYETSSRKQKLTAALLGFSLLSTCLLLLAQRSSETTSEALGSTPLYFLGVFMKLIAVLLLFVFSAVVFRRWLQYGPNTRKVRQMRLLETVRLSPKQALHLISVGDQQLLIGATDQSVSLITLVESNLEVESPGDAAVPPALEFGTLLQSFNFHLPGGSPK